MASREIPVNSFRPVLLLLAGVSPSWGAGVFAWRDRLIPASTTQGRGFLSSVSVPQNSLALL